MASTSRLRRWCKSVTRTMSTTTIPRSSRTTVFPANTAPTTSSPPAPTKNRRRPTDAREMRPGERGQVLPLVALVLAFAIVVAVAVAHLAIDATERAQAEHAADAVALAGAAGDETAA